MKRNLAGLMALAGLAISAGTVHAQSATTAQNDLLNATLWTQTSVEFKANAIASYRLAKIMLDRALADKDWTAATEQSGAYQGKPPAVVLDVDAGRENSDTIGNLGPIDFPPFHQAL